jgi:hypothetical protein
MPEPADMQVQEVNNDLWPLLDAAAEHMKESHPGWSMFYRRVADAIQEMMGVPVQ